MPIAMLTDFGTRDYYVGAMKGVILNIDPRAVIVDLTHEIEPQNINAAAFILRACYRDFPAGTVFLCVVDPGVGSDRRRIIVESNGYFFVGPDNGLFSFVLNSESAVCSIENDRFFHKPVSKTFHGRDIFAPVAAHLSNGVARGEFGPRINNPARLPNVDLRQIGDDEFEATIIHIDRFGNLISSIPAEFAARPFELVIGNTRVTECHKTYAEAEPYKPFAIAGSAGFIEISVNSGSAAKLLGATVGSTVTIRQK